MNVKRFSVRFIVLIVVASFCTSLVTATASTNVGSSEPKETPVCPEVHVDTATLLKQLGYTDDQIKNVNMATLIKLMREYPAPAKLSTDGKYYATPTIADKVNYTEPELKVINASQKFNSDGTMEQQYSLAGRGSGKACLLISIWDYWQTEVLPKLPEGDYNQYYSHIISCGKYDYWHTLTNGEATHYYIWAWITWACAEYDTVDVIMTGHGAVWVGNTIASSVFCSWDVQCGIPGFLYYWNFFYPTEIMNGYSSYCYSSLRMGNLHFCNSWGGSWFLGFEPAFAEDTLPPRGHNSAFMGFSDIGYTSEDFAREWSKRWLYWSWDSWSAYSDSIQYQYKQDEYPLWYADHGGTVYA